MSIYKCIFVVFLNIFGVIPVMAGVHLTNSSSKITGEQYGRVVDLVREISVLSDSSSEDFWGSKVEKIEIGLVDSWIGNNLYAASNGEVEGCKINVYVQKDGFTDFEYLKFVILHEIAHCYSGKKFLTSTDFKWGIEVSEAEKLKINAYIESQTYNTFLKKTKIPHPYFVLHEILADINAIFWWLNAGYNTDFLNKILDLRKAGLEKNGIETLHATSWAIQELKDKINKGESIKKQEIIENGFLNYLKFILD